MASGEVACVVLDVDLGGGDLAAFCFATRGRVRIVLLGPPWASEAARPETAAFSDAILRAMAKEPADRYPVGRSVQRSPAGHHASRLAFFLSCPSERPSHQRQTKPTTMTGGTFIAHASHA